MSERITHGRTGGPLYTNIAAPRNTDRRATGRTPQPTLQTSTVAANTLTGVGHNQQNMHQNSTQDKQEYAGA
jgi:hypothetical protein